MNRREAIEITGGLSQTTKMPCKSYGLPQNRCVVGNKLRKIPGTVCSKCYAAKGPYGFPNVQNAAKRRYEAVNDPAWVEAMVTLIKGDAYFRWHDTGDLRSVEHFAKIVKIASLLPDTKFWLPTMEHRLVNLTEKLPDNLTIRVSSPKIDVPVSSRFPVSVVVSRSSKAVRCPAPVQEGKCKECRMCWDKSVQVVYYSEH